MTAGGFFKAIGKAVANGVRSSVTRVKNLFGKNKNKYSTRTKSRTRAGKNNAKPANAPPANAPKPANAPPAVGGKKMRASNLGKLMFYKPKRKATRRKSKVSRRRR